MPRLPAGAPRAYTTLSIPTPLYDRANEWIANHPADGYRSASELVVHLLRDHLGPATHAPAPAPEASA